MSPDLGERLAAIRDRVAAAARRSGREPAAITTIVVTKFQPVELVRELRELGVTDFGENRHQEAREKAALVPDVHWHFVGQLQGKKARQVRAYASVIHSIDRVSLVDTLDSPGESADSSAAPPTVDVFAQVNLTDDPGRGGAAPADLPALVERIEAAPGLRLLGVMAVAPLGEEPRAAFARLRGIADEVRRIAPGATRISAGMSADFEDAIAEGATHLRIGTAITGSRPDRA
ncbi:YggS family pyridoxal phosphate-dependent enzyme [Naasia sp. SYSU D00057]|uniref:YggS family pyridoxal phosphate-dependent enzyme n=1 Tax=Naasia sp. SYSU D00057 TaxID=2817380 RepID=UPI001B310FBE|nr:YggS family pyridoxal phosphate-dependent enzyme [Naasia sp. SYSU D00057]